MRQLLHQLLCQLLRQLLRHHLKNKSSTVVLSESVADNETITEADTDEAVAQVVALR